LAVWDSAVIIIPTQPATSRHAAMLNGTLQSDMTGTMTAGHALRIADRRLGPMSRSLFWYFVGEQSRSQ
jgi:hypothetical protein